MNEPKQITEEEAINNFCNEIICVNLTEIHNKECSNRCFCCGLKNFLDFGKKLGWIKPDPTPEEKFWKEFYTDFDFGNNKALINWFKTAIEKLAAEIRAEIKKERD